ncbi:hypothetical protein BLOT_005237 [Blomia tropicalis]|nr:hypothetical protein BLOT_005237 [Blomia tropicalis]
MSSSDDSFPTPPTQPPPPPPPLPPIIKDNKMFLNNNLGFKSFNQNNEPNSKKMIEDQLETIILNSIQEETITLLSMYHHCDSVIQSGPTCGLVALMICLKLVKPDVQTELSAVLERARSFGFTKYGEMFSVENMAKFIEQEFSVRVQTRQWLEKSKLNVVEHLCLGMPLLVPYDADANYEPCMKEGKRAHWATICGFCLVIPTGLLSKNDQWRHIPLSNPNHSIIHLETTIGTDLSRDQFKLMKAVLPKSKLYIYARQGKSRRIQIWNYEQLCKSNRNLYRVSNKILNDPERMEMIFPENGDLTQSLANQFIMVYK